MIRGPSYHKEVEAGVYPRPMEVNKGTNAMHLARSGSVTKLPREERQPPAKGLKGMFGKRRGVAVN